MVGRSLSHFRIVAEVGAGGMGTVYRAEDQKLRRTVALKVLSPDSAGVEGPRRLLREARAALPETHSPSASRRDTNVWFMVMPRSPPQVNSKGTLVSPGKRRSKATPGIIPRARKRCRGPKTQA